MRSWITQKWSGEWGGYLRFISKLLIVIAGVFVYFSVTGCCGGGVEQYPLYSYSSDESPVRKVASAPYNLSTSGSGDQRAAADGAVAPGSTVTRYITYTVETGYDPTQIEWTPPDGASGFNFYSNPPTNPGGPAPYIFDNDPVLTLPLHISYTAPALPSGKSSLVVGEVFKAVRGDFADDIHVLNYTLSATASADIEVPPPPAGRTIQPRTASTVSSAVIRRWYGAEGTTLTTALCQQLYDWLQSENTFIAMRMPVDTSSSPDYELPVLFPPVSYQPRAEMQVNGSSIQNFSAVYRSDRMVLLENNFPSAAGEHWVALGLDTTTPATCPTGLNAANWEFYFQVPTHPAVPIDSMPLYYCQEGQNPPPLGLAALVLQADKEKRTQLEGITCLGPYAQSIVSNPALKIGHPNVVWDAYAGDSIQMMHYIQRLGTVPAYKFSITSETAGFNWKLYKGDENAPNLSQEIDMAQVYTPASSFEFVWLTGTVPAGVSAGSANFTFKVEKSDDPAVYAVATDIIWMGEWVEPPPGPGPSR